MGPTRALSSFLKFNFNSSTKLNKYDGHAVIKPTIPNGCFDAYELKVKNIFPSMRKRKTNLSIPGMYLFFNGLSEFASFP